MQGAIAFIRGIGIKTIRPALYGWFFNILITIFIYYTFYKAFSVPAGMANINTGDGAALSTFTFLSDIFRHYEGAWHLVFSLTFFFMVVFLLVSIFVSGGIYYVLVEEERTSLTNLLTASTQNFFSMLVMALANLVVLIVALILPGILAVVFFSARSLAVNEALVETAIWILAGLSALCAGIAMAVYDYSRIIRLRDDKSVFYSIKQAIRFLFANKINTLVIFLLYGLSLFIIYLIYLALSGLFSGLPAILLFMFYQMIILMRYFLKIVVMRGEILLLKD